LAACSLPARTLWGEGKVFPDALAEYGPPSWRWPRFRIVVVVVVVLVVELGGGKSRRFDDDDEDDDEHEEANGGPAPIPEVILALAMLLDKSGERM
jgi:hypothetical protein